MYYLDSVSRKQWSEEATFLTLAQAMQDGVSESFTAQEVLEETIFSPSISNDKNFFHGIGDCGNFSPEAFINIHEMHLDTSILNTHTTTDTIIPPDTILDSTLSPDTIADTTIPPDTTIDTTISPDTTIDATLSPDGHNILINFNNAQEYLRLPLQDNLNIANAISDEDTIAVVPNVIPESPASIPNSPVDSTDIGDYSNTFEFESTSAIIKFLETSSETKYQSSERQVLDNVDTLPPKKQKLLHKVCANEVEDKVVKRRVKNNAASRRCRASRKSCHEALFKKEKELISQNMELKTQVETLSAAVDYLRQHLVSKLSGKSC